MHQAMAAAAMETERSPAAALSYGTGGEEEEKGGVFGGGRFLAAAAAARPGVVTQQLFPTTTQAVERCVLQAGAAASGRWARPASRAKSRRGPRSRSSQYRGVTFYRRTGRWESHIWDCGKQVYLGGFDTAQAAARAYDQAAIKFRGVDADINFSLDDYKEDIKKMSGCSKEEFVQVVRRLGAGFVRGSSRFRGVTLHKCGKWEARIGKLMGNKFVYLGLYDTEMDATMAYDKAAMDHCGEEAAANFEEEPKAASPACNGLQSWGSEPDLELSLGCSGGGGGDPATANGRGDGLHVVAPGSRRTSLTLEMPVEDEETAALCAGSKRSNWIRPPSRTMTAPNPTLGWRLDGDHHPSSISEMLQMGGMISGGGRAEAEELHILGWPTGGSRTPPLQHHQDSHRRPAAGVEPPPAGRQGAAVALNH